MDDRRLPGFPLFARGTRPLRVVEHQDHLLYPAGVIEFLEDRVEVPD